MYTHADGFIAPCLYGGKEKRMGYILYNDADEDILIQSHHISGNVLSEGGKIRVFGELVSKNGIREMSVDRYTLLN